MSNDLNRIEFQDETKAREWLEGMHWPEGPVCSHCGTVDNSTPIHTRPGWHQCNSRECRAQFSVTTGTLFERSHVPLNKWLMAAFILCASKKGVSTHQIHRMIGVTYKTAWFMMHRLREGMRPVNPDRMGGGGTVEADETYYGRKAESKAFKPPVEKQKVLALVERDGKVRSFHMKGFSRKQMLKTLKANVAPDARLMTDESGLYRLFGAHFDGGHYTITHNKREYVKGDIHTNTAEGFFSIFKRGMTGIYQHCDAKHLHRYLAEFDFRYNERAALEVTDAERTTKALKGIVGKRLTYRRTNSSATS
jgi:transposase-like protein